MNPLLSSIRLEIRRAQPSRFFFQKHRTYGGYYIVQTGFWLLTIILVYYPKDSRT